MATLWLMALLSIIVAVGVGTPVEGEQSKDGEAVKEENVKTEGEKGGEKLSIQCCQVNLLRLTRLNRKGIKCTPFDLAMAFAGAAKGGKLVENIGAEHEEGNAEGGGGGVIGGKGKVEGGESGVSGGEGHVDGAESGAFGRKGMLEGGMSGGLGRHQGMVEGRVSSVPGGMGMSGGGVSGGLGRRGMPEGRVSSVPGGKGMSGGGVSDGLGGKGTAEARSGGGIGRKGKQPDGGEAGFFRGEWEEWYREGGNSGCEEECVLDKNGLLDEEKSIKVAEMKEKLLSGVNADALPTLSAALDKCFDQDKINNEGQTGPKSSICDRVKKIGKCINNEILENCPEQFWRTNIPKCNYGRSKTPVEAAAPGVKV